MTKPTYADEFGASMFQQPPHWLFILVAAVLLFASLVIPRGG